MKKVNRSLILYLILSGFISFQSNYVFADDNVEIKFVYSKIEEIIDYRNMSSDEFIQKRKEIDKEGYTFKYSITDGFAYKIKNTVVSSEEELLEAMGAKSKLSLKYGQKCLLDAFNTANSEKIQQKAEGIKDNDNLEIELVDTSNDGHFFGKGYDTSKSGLKPDIRKDFWPCSYVYRNKILLSDVTAKYQQKININKKGIDINSITGRKNLASTVYHEYAHYLDDTEFDSEKYNEKNKYGLDEIHYTNEITNQRSAFIEGWAEYNQMIESRKQAKYYKNSTKSLKIESEEEAGKYTKIAPEDCDFSTLLKSEAYNANLLYRLSQKLGEEKITETFIESRDNKYRDLQYFIKTLVELHPEDTETICEVIDEVFNYKASDEELYEMVGKSETTRSYVDKRKLYQNPVKNVFKNVKESVSESIENVKDFGEKVGKKIKSGKKEVVKNVKEGVSENAERINNFGEKLVKALKSEKKEVVEKSSGLFSNFVNNCKSIFAKGVEKGREVIDPTFDKIKDFFRSGNSVAKANETSEYGNEELGETIDAYDYSSEELEETDEYSSENDVKKYQPEIKEKKNQGSYSNPFNIGR